MLVEDTPVEDYRPAFGLWVKREDLSCPPPGPPFSKTRGVFAHVRARPESVIGVLDTYHSQGGHAVAQACHLLGKLCMNYYPLFKRDQATRPPQLWAESLGALLQPLPAGRSSVLYHQAKRKLAQVPDSYMMPNALKLPEMVEETQAEVRRTLTPEFLDALGPLTPVLISVSSGTIAAGVIRGFILAGASERPFILHMGYARSRSALMGYVQQMGSLVLPQLDIRLVDEGYEYKMKAAPGELPLWPCNPYYDLKAFRWWMREGRAIWGEALLWNIG